MYVYMVRVLFAVWIPVCVCVAAVPKRTRAGWKIAYEEKYEEK